MPQIASNFSTPPLRPGTRVFVDTNVIVYAYSESEPVKRELARAALNDIEPVISTQVLSEFCNYLLRKLKISASDARILVDNLTDRCIVEPVTPDIVREALRLNARYGWSYYDSQIIAAALDCGVDVLYSEDMQAGQVVDGVLTIASPFRHGYALHEPAAPAYVVQPEAVPAIAKTRRKK